MAWRAPETAAMPDIHPTAVVDRNAELADDVRIGPYSVIGSRVRVGVGTVIGTHCVVTGRTTLGRYNRVTHHACLGGDPQDLKYRGEDTTLEIGDFNVIREHVSMHTGTANGGGRTVVGSHNLFMVNAHVAHDCIVSDHCILDNNVMMAGHVVLQDWAILSGGVAVGHYVTIGRHAFLGGLAGVIHDCPPYMISDGHPAHVRGPNKIGLQRRGFEAETIERIKRAFLMIWGKSRGEASIGAALERVEAELGEDAHIRELVTFTRNLVSAPAGRHAETMRRDDKRAPRA